MYLPAKFINIANFRLAYLRIIRGGNKEYKNFYRHLFPSFSVGLEENLINIISELKTEQYQPSKPIRVYQPKKSGILRPLTILSLTDLIVYQAITNHIALSFEEEQKKYAYKKCFGAIFAGKGSPFFYNSWKVSYRNYNEVIEKAFKAGNDHIADFDLVSFYELIDHYLLRNCLKKKVNNTSLLELLFNCLERWTIDQAGSNIHHGVPQGPEPSAFLAECFLLHFDAKKYTDVKYFRYVDDIKLMARDEIPLRRALLRLDLASKELGLVPQAQKIEIYKAESIEDIRKTIPSALIKAYSVEPQREETQKELLNIFRRSIRKIKKEWSIIDLTKFKYTLLRIKPMKSILIRISSFLTKRPDCSWFLASYLKKFPNNRFAADIIYDALKISPIYDAAAANYIDAMDLCEPRDNNSTYRQIIKTANRRSEEKSILLTIASLTFRGKRMDSPNAIKLIAGNNNALVKSLLINRLFDDSLDNSYEVNNWKELFENGTQSDNTDLARYCALFLLENWPNWHPSRLANRSVKIFAKAIGIRSRGPRKNCIIETFFKNKEKIAINISWKKALKKDYNDAVKRCLRMQKLRNLDSTSFILMLDTFNEVLIQSFSKRHVTLKPAYIAASGNKPNPDIGNWLENPALSNVLPTGISWFKDVHKTRVAADLAHARIKSGTRKGSPTKPINHRKIDKIMKQSKIAWAELIMAWVAIL